MDPKRHHYIPVFYLSEWASGDPLLLCQMSRPHKGIACKTKSPSAMGYQDDLYALAHVGEEMKQVLEKIFFQKTDDAGAKAMQMLLAGNVDLEGSIREDWVRFVMSLLSRNPEKIAYIRGAYEDQIPGFRAELEAIFDIQYSAQVPPPTAEEKSAELDKRINLSVGRLIQNVVAYPQVMADISAMTWATITIDDGGRDFLTCDRPVYMSKGPQHEDAYLVLPISPRTIFIASRSQAELDKLIAMDKGDITQGVNKALATQAVKYVFGTNDSQRNFVDKYLGAA